MSTSTNSIDKLTASNYRTWRIQVDMLLAERDQLDISKQDPPVDTDDLAKWTALDMKARATITLTISSSILLQVTACKTAKDILRTLADTYQSKGLATIYHLRRKFFMSKMSPGTSCAEHINHTLSLADQIANIDIPLRSMDIIMVLLSSLPSDFSSLVISLVNSNESLTIEKVKSSICNTHNFRREDR